MQKFSISFILYIFLAVGLVFPLFNHARLTGPDPLTLNFVFTLAPYLFFVVLGAVYIHEQMEEKTNGYSFLRILPVRASDVVVSKFLLVFLTTLVYVGFHCVAFVNISPDPSYVYPSCSFLIINANIYLVLTALLYVGIFRYGNSKIGKLIFFLWILREFAPRGRYKSGGWKVDLRTGGGRPSVVRGGWSGTLVGKPAVAPGGSGSSGDCARLSLSKSTFRGRRA